MRMFSHILKHDIGISMMPTTWPRPSEGYDRMDASLKIAQEPYRSIDTKVTSTATREERERGRLPAQNSTLTRCSY